MLEVFRLQEWAGWDGACTTLEFAEGADAVVEEIECLDELVGGDVVYVAMGYEGCILCVP